MNAFLADRLGATAIEYAMIAGLISIVVVGAATAIGGKLASFLTAVTDGFQ